MRDGQKSPGSCADCGDDAYIRLAATNGDQEMVCAHCFADRIRMGKAPTEMPEARPVGRKVH